MSAPTLERDVPDHCEECGCRDLVEDTKNGDLVCPECGLVAASLLVDLGHEWRTFENDEAAADPNRIGGVMNPLLDTGPTTSISNGPAMGNALNARLNKAQSRSAMSASDRYVSECFGRIVLRSTDAERRRHALAGAFSGGRDAGHGIRRAVHRLPQRRRAAHVQRSVRAGEGGAFARRRLRQGHRVVAGRGGQGESPTHHRRFRGAIRVALGAAIVCDGGGAASGATGARYRGRPRTHTCVDRGGRVTLRDHAVAGVLGKARRRAGQGAVGVEPASAPHPSVRIVGKCGAHGGQSHSRRHPPRGGAVAARLVTAISRQRARGECGRRCGRAGEPAVIEW
eukprot:ctg_2821.g593